MTKTQAELAVPAIDISALVSCQTDEEVQAKANDSSLEGAAFHKLVEELRAAATEWGFFYIKNHGVSEEDIEDLRANARTFFALSKDVKNQTRRSAHNSRGYFDDELTKNKLDWKEVFDIGGRLEDEPVDVNGYKRMDEDQNQWLAEETVPGFRKKMQDYYERVQLIARRLILLFSVVLGRDPTYLDQFFKNDKGQLESSSLLRLNHYPVSPEPEKTMGVYHHTDAGALTVLLQDDNVTSLQVFHRESQQWCFVPPLKGSYVINIGDMLQIWSNDRFQAPLHRVLSSGSAGRISIPFFYHPIFEADVQPIINDEQEKPHYRTLNWYDFILKRSQGNYADLGEEVQIAQYRI